MKCECGNIIKWKDIINPFKKSYKVQVTDNGKIIEEFRVCDTCGKKYEVIEGLINTIGEKETLKLLDEMR